MSSRASASPSEGEIVESGSEKANKLTKTNNGTSVDRQSRHRVSISPSPSPYRSPGSYRPQDLSRDRSRSPYRESRGSKREHQGDHYEHSRSDHRRFKVRYEDSKAKDRSSVQFPQWELYHRGPLDRKHSRKEDRNLVSHSRAKFDQGRRDRSPKPSRDSGGYLGQGSNRGGRFSPHYHCDQDSGNRQGYRDKYNGEQSVSNRSGAPISIAQSRHHAESSDVQTLPHSTIDIAGVEDQAANGALLASKNDIDTNFPPSQAQSDEAAVIEERRKRREAIKAKYRGQATPMLAQALALDSKTDQTENSSAQLSPKASFPNTPKASGQSDSPTHFVVTHDTDLANNNATSNPATGEDEPSAADYDPKMDMQEDKMRYDQRQHHHSVSALAQEEIRQSNHNALTSRQVVSKPTKQRADELDMFAEGGDMDMFADSSSTARIVEQEVNQAVPATTAQAIDMSMLDDWDDHEGYYKVMLGELLDGRYHVQSNLGRGMFSGVVRATDQKTRRLVAIKVVRNNETMYKAGQKEIGILQTIRNADLEDKKHLIRLERSFEHKGHLCMVFENLSINLREVLKKFGRDVGINLKAVRAYAQQMFLGLSLLRKCNVLHADLKPDNVLVNETRNVLKICDLGSASDASENEITQYLVSRFYRAPEIILGLPYDFAIDMWSVGCTLFELYTGKILFTGRSNNQMLRVMMECRGKFSHKMLRKAQFAGHHFDDLLNFKSIEKDRLTGKDTMRLLNLAKPTRDLKTRLASNSKGMSDAEIRETTMFADLLDRCLNLNPEKRCTPTEALRHPFITKQKA